MSSFGGSNVKKIWILGVMMLLCCGCGAQETFETVGIVEQSPVTAAPWQMIFDLPSDAGKPVMESEQSGTLYFCEDYTLTLQTLDGGDLNRTFAQCTGFSKDALQVMQTESQGVKRYEAVWTAAAEDGEQVGRIAVLDDGNYHYVLTVMADASKAGKLTSEWQSLFRSVHIEDPETLVNIGS